MEADSDLEFMEDATPLGDLVNAIQRGDIDATAAQIRDGTSWALSEHLIWGIIGVAAINAIANLVRRSTPLAQPIADAMAEKMRQPPQG
jgi:hypothetical protein